MSRIIKTIYNKMYNDYITTQRRMSKEVIDKSQTLNILALVALFILSTLGN